MPLSVVGGLVTFSVCYLAIVHDNFKSLTVIYLLCTLLGLPYCYAQYLHFTRRFRFTQRSKA